jgi:hypothetical protein
MPRATKTSTAPTETAEKRAARAAAKLQEIFSEALVPGSSCSVAVLSFPAHVAVVFFSGALADETRNAITVNDVWAVRQIFERATGLLVHSAEPFVDFAYSGVLVTAEIQRDSTDTDGILAGTTPMADAMPNVLDDEHPAMTAPRGFLH